MISVIHPSRSRPEIAKAVYDNWMSKKSGEVEWILCIDIDDPFRFQYENLFRGYAKFHIGQNRSAIDAINKGATRAENNIFIVVSDDFDCPENWDMRILEATKGKTDWILKTQDGTQGWIITLPIMDRAYYNRFGYIYHPDYKHLFCDTEMTCVADLLQRKLTADILFPHSHSAIDDEVKKKSNATWKQGEDLFRLRYRMNFELSRKQITGKITDKAMIDWIRR